MHIISRRILLEFCQIHRDAEQQIRAWYAEARHAQWKTPADIKARYRNADFLPGNRVIFNIKGNHYRLVVSINYSLGNVYIRFIGTHSEYDRIDATKV